MPRLELFPFRFRNRITGKWVRARYVATREEIAKGNAEWELIEPPEIRDVDWNAPYFTPFRDTPHAEAMRMFEPPPQINPHLECPLAIDSAERFLTSDANRLRRAEGSSSRHHPVHARAPSV